MGGHFLIQLAVFLGVAAFAGPVARMLKLGSILGYLLAGAFIGPYGAAKFLGICRRRDTSPDREESRSAGLSLNLSARRATKALGPNAQVSAKGGINMRSSVERSIQLPSRRGFCAALLALVLALPLGACGPSEPQQRKAFADFLKARIVDKPGIHLPVPTADERKSWGPYAAQFDVIADFNHALDDAARAAFGDFGALAANARTIGSLLGQRNEIARIRDGAEAFQDTVKRQLEIANAARAAFPPQPDHLKRVYDAAYERDVSGPAAFWIEAAPTVQRTLTSFLDMIGFIEQHKRAITVNGPMVTPSDPKLVPQLTELMNAMNDTISS